MGDATSERANASPHASRGLPPDPGMRGFLTALDPEAMAARLSEYVLCGQDVRSCRVVRFRYRRGDRLIVVYEADVADAGRGSVRHLLTGRIHAARAPKAAKPGRANGTPAVISELGMKVDVYPADRRLQALRDFSEGPGERAMALLRQGYQGVRLARGNIEITPIRYRPGLSATLRYRFEDSDLPGMPGTCFVKVTSDPDIAAEANAARRINAALARAGAPLMLSVPLAVSPSCGAALYRPAVGRSLQDIAESGCDAARAAARAGTQLAVLHTADATGLPTTTATGLSEDIDRAARIVSWACPDLVDRVAATVARARNLVGVDIRAPVHRDMKPDHIFLSDGGRAEMIDTGSVSAGNPVVDVGSLLARIDLLAATGALAPHRATEIKSTLCSAYFDRVPRAWQAQLEPARAFGALLVATHAIQGLLPDWRAIVNSELETASAPWG